MGLWYLVHRISIFLSPFFFFFFFSPCLVSISCSCHTLHLCQTSLPSRYNVWDSAAVASVPPYLHLHQPTMPKTEQHTSSYLTDRKWHFKSVKSTWSWFLFLSGGKQDSALQVVLNSSASLTTEYENLAWWLRLATRLSYICLFRPDIHSFFFFFFFWLPKYWMCVI